MDQSDQAASVASDSSSDIYKSPEVDAVAQVARSTPEIPIAPSQQGAAIEETRQDPPADATGPPPSLSQPTPDDENLEMRVEAVQNRIARYYPVNADSAPPPPSCLGIPAEVWQNVFLHLAPRTLGICLSVTRAFHILLTATGYPGNRSVPGRLCLITSESLWARSRGTFHPRMPRPLLDTSELTMWKLVGGRLCHFCGKSTPQTPAPVNGQRRDPGKRRVRIIWPFAVRSCYLCLQQHVMREIDLAASSGAALIPALWYAYFDTHGNYFPTSSIETVHQPPDTLKFAPGRYYYNPQIQQIGASWNTARSLGAAAEGEWLKGLANAGKERRADYIRWEKFEKSGHLVNLFLTPAKQTATSFASPIDSTARNGRNAPSINTPALNGKTHARLAVTHPPPFPALPAMKPVRSKRTAPDASSAKFARQADIETRCMALDPPIPPSVLRHMEAFRAAIQISTPMTDQAWSVLEPRLQAQRHAAVGLESEHNRNLMLIQAQMENTYRQAMSHSKESKDTVDPKWEEAQAPIRAALMTYADAFIQKQWSSGRAVNQTNCSQFAVQVLNEVRQRWYTELGKTDRDTLASGRPIIPDPIDGPPRRKLVLENMKTVFDFKIRPITERFRKDIFLCDGDGCEYNSKLYGFEGLVQHYGAKHTSSFSLGNIIVHWPSAEWPANLPFRLDTPAQAHANHGPHHGGFSRPSVTPQMGRNGPFASPQQMSPAYGHSNLNALPEGHYPAGNGNGYLQPTQDQSRSSPGPVIGNDLETILPNMRPEQGPYAPRDSKATDRSRRPAADVSDKNADQNPTGPRNAVVKSIVSEELPDFETHRKQVKDLAESCRELWTKTSGVANVPQSVRAFVAIHDAIARYMDKGNSEPGVEIFTEALTNEFAMNPFTSLNDFKCGFCPAPGAGNVTLDATSFASEEAKFSDLKSLTFHFQEFHSDDSHSASSSERPHWLKMIGLPPREEITLLADAPGMTEDKMRLFGEALPGVFPRRTKKPRKRNRSSDEELPQRRQYKDSRRRTSYRNVSPDLPSAGGRMLDESSSRGPTRRSQVSHPSASHEEYDPRRPALELEVGLPAQRYSRDQHTRFGDGRHHMQEEPVDDHNWRGLRSPSPPTVRRIAPQPVQPGFEEIYCKETGRYIQQPIPQAFRNQFVEDELSEDGENHDHVSEVSRSGALSAHVPFALSGLIGPREYSKAHAGPQDPLFSTAMESGSVSHSSRRTNAFSDHEHNLNGRMEWSNRGRYDRYNVERRNDRGRSMSPDRPPVTYSSHYYREREREQFGGISRRLRPFHEASTRTYVSTRGARYSPEERLHYVGEPGYPSERVRYVGEPGYPSERGSQLVMVRDAPPPMHVRPREEYVQFFDHANYEHRQTRERTHDEMPLRGQGMYDPHDPYEAQPPRRIYGREL
ncbi:hypothetical protein K402DRAFT_416633 [Aulographum hederae CBS 113979]|uniref:DUF7892 domain-containing protein n=1 Tax=Aulographum hederae CBS 113979 TaxID=1176131 RepID=A0A6G1HG01_9PEZI|nr:hypothetical protein K402DRAFT_416633 [Aulographum hederae CBS 113979]